MSSAQSGAGTTPQDLTDGDDPRVRVSARRLRERISEVLVAAGAPTTHADLQADLLTEAELRGHASHGLLRLPRLVARIANGVLDPAATGSHRWAKPALLVTDGEDGFGPVIAFAALDRLTARARETGSATAVISGNNHLGMLAYYADHVARRGQVLIATTSTEALVHPWGGREALVGTNPIAIGVPADPEPLVLDMATSRVSAGKIRHHAGRGQPIPEGWALDAVGNPTTDAAAAVDGALAPFGGAKGYGLAVALGALTGALTASALGRDVTGTLSDKAPNTKGDVFVVVEVPASARRAVGAYLQTLRSSNPSDPANPVSVPGDGGLRRRTAALHDGVVLSAELWQRIRALDPTTSPDHAKDTR
ncbi:Ldh family oxidoreductase [Modestobacter lapidis]|nr:Ldh family oxidoreductase [Modestobacter lapidis]